MTDPLPLRRLHWMLAEAERWNGAPVDDNRVAQYLSGCQRDRVRNLGPWLARRRLKGHRVAFCAASIGFAEARVTLPEERRPPWRAGAKEIRADALSGRRGRWVPAVDMQLGYRPPPGSVLIYDRGGWKGHAETLLCATDEGYRSIGANERGGQWVVDEKPVSYTHPQLLGAVVEHEPLPPETAIDLFPEPLPPDFTEQADDLTDIVAGRQLTLTPDWNQLRALRDQHVKERYG